MAHIAPRGSAVVVRYGGIVRSVRRAALHSAALRRYGGLYAAWLLNAARYNGILLLRCAALSDRARSSFKALRFLSFRRLFVQQNVLIADKSAGVLQFFRAWNMRRFSKAPRLYKRPNRGVKRAACERGKIKGRF